MRILVTGGLGTVGSVLVRELRRRGYEVWLCDLQHHHDPQYVRCDVSSFRQLQRMFDAQHFDIVYHLAAEFGRWNGEDFYENLWRTNVIGTKHLLQFQVQQGWRLVHFSSSEVYGDYRGVMKEDVMDQHEIRQLNDYAISKWVNELQIMNTTEQRGVESVRVRLFNTYGPGEYYGTYRSVVSRFIYCALHGMPYQVYLKHRRTSIYVTDTVRTLANIAERFTPGEVYNIASTEEHDIKTLSNSILGYLDMDDRLVEYCESEPFTTTVKQPDVSKAVRDLNHTCAVSLKDGLARTIEWMKAVYQDGGKHVDPLMETFLWDQEQTHTTSVSKTTVEHEG